MPETLTLMVPIDLDTLEALAAPVQLISGKVEQMFEAAEQAAAAAGRKLERGAWRLQTFVTEPDPRTGVPAQLILKLTGVGHLIHVTEEDVLGRRWYAVPETLIGGWAIATVDQPTSEIDMGNTDERVMAECWGERTARHLVELHNARLDRETGLDEAFFRRLIAFSQQAFGPHERTQGLLDHARKELIEIEEDPHDVGEWVDLALLAFDGAWRHGATPAQFIAAVHAKLAKNEKRTWPDWRTAPEGKAIEHDRTLEDEIEADTRQAIARIESSS